MILFFSVLRFYARRVELRVSFSFSSSILRAPRRIESVLFDSTRAAQIEMSHHHQCTQCSQIFTSAPSLVRHVSACHDKLKPFVCGNCGRAFAAESALERHARIKHLEKHRLRCVTCGKGYDDARWLAAHAKRHAKVVADTVPAPRGFITRQLVRQAEELQSLRRDASPYPCKGKDVCQVHARDRNTSEIAFTCLECNRIWHWACVGYDYERLKSLPVVVCPNCLITQGKSVAECEMVVVHRQMLEEHVRSIGHDIKEIPADGWCLVRSVADATGNDKSDLLKQALQLLVCMLPDLPIADEERVSIAVDCQRLLTLGTRIQMKRQWDSALCDHLPQVLANVVCRPLHILQALNSEIKVVVVSPNEHVDEDGEPILLVKSYAELGCDHYDLVTAAGGYLISTD